MTADDPDPEPPLITWRQLWAETAAAIGERHHARWMCEVASGCDPSTFLSELDQPATRRMVAHLDAMIARSAAGEPLQYVLGSWQFRTLDLMVDRRVLIPRPETEWVCETALRLIRSVDARPRLIADLGTGSGAIGLSLAAELPVGSAEIWLTDDSADALDVARANLAGIGRNASAVRLTHGSWFQALPTDRRGTFHVIVANPPYIAVDDPLVDQSVMSWEPHQALFSGADGLDHIRILCGQAGEWLAANGWLIMEIGMAQGPAVHDLMTRAGFRGVEVEKDLAGHDRIVMGHR